LVSGTWTFAVSSTGSVTLNGTPFVSGNVTAASGTGTTTTFVISNVTASTGTNSGALTVAGGVGIAGGIYVGGTVTATNFGVNGYQVSTSTASALSVQYSGVTLGTANTLNFATGTTATLVGTVLTIQATASGGGGSSGGLSGSTATFSWSMDGGGFVPSTGDKAVIQVPFGCYVTQATVLGNTTGSALIYVSTSTVALWPSRTLISSSTINLSSVATLQITTASWTNTALGAGSLIVASLQTVSTFIVLTLKLKVIR